MAVADGRLLSVNQRTATILAQQRRRPIRQPSPRRRCPRCGLPCRPHRGAAASQRRPPIPVLPTCSRSTTR
ncbi:MAG: hypothetical protein MZW92_79490 [Comamonadaceae bacterium]|nr:hypothetical protein [Comamonadaceae bacterium]